MRETEFSGLFCVSSNLYAALQQDNYVFTFLLPPAPAPAPAPAAAAGAGDVVCVIDPSEERPVLEALEAFGWLKGGARVAIINTHHHWDHTGGNIALRESLLALGEEKVKEVKIFGNQADRERIPGIDVGVRDGESFEPFAGCSDRFHVTDVSGHTVGHVMYTLPKHNVCFVGDTVFAMGCGRVFEGSAPQMHESVQKIASLPPSMRLFPAHEYTSSNARFALSVDGANEKLLARSERVRELRSRGEPTVPTTVQEELDTNPFMRVDDAALRGTARIPMSDSSAEAFRKIRQMKDNF